jgi:ribosomal protein S18 acetylase RimI-like enzyme
MNAKIATATITDIPQLLQLVNQAYRGETAKKGWTHEAHLIEGNLRTDAPSLQKMMEDPNAVMLKCVMDDVIVGTVYLQKRNDHVYLGMLSVNPDIQARGIGKKLLAAAEVYAQEQNCHRIVMTVISVRHELIDWYRRHGYQFTGVTQPFPSENRFGQPREPLEFVVLEKKVEEVKTKK